MRQWFLRYRKILLLSLAAVVLLSVVLYLCPWRFTTVYNDIDWEGLGTNCTVIYTEIDRNPSGRAGEISTYYDVPVETLREVLEDTWIRRDIFRSQAGTAPYIEFIVDVHTADETTENSCYFIFGSKRDLTCFMHLYDVQGSDWYRIDSKREEWIVTGGEPFDGLHALLEDLEPTRTDSAFAS